MFRLEGEHHSWSTICPIRIWYRILLSLPNSYWTTNVIVVSWDTLDAVAVTVTV